MVSVGKIDTPSCEISYVTGEGRATKGAGCRFGRASVLDVLRNTYQVKMVSAGSSHGCTIEIA